jgi:N-acetylglucosamine-6-phosphate deacetylase
MPSILPAPHRASGSSGVIKFTNCLVVRDTSLVNQDLWVSSTSGKILNGQEILYEYRTAPEAIVDLGGRILSPGLIDTQLNGAYGFDFSVIPEEGTAEYGKGVLRVNQSLVATGVTSYLPTLTSQRPELYQKVTKPINQSTLHANVAPGSALPWSFRRCTRRFLWLRITRRPLRRPISQSDEKWNPQCNCSSRAYQWHIGPHRLLWHKQR